MFLLLIITALSIDTIASIRKQISNKQYNAAYQAANSMITSQGILDADSILFFLRGCSAVKIGKYSQSINDLSRFLRTGTNINQKDQKEALVLRGTAYLKIGNLEDAKNDAESSKDESLMKLVKKASFLLNSAQSNETTPQFALNKYSELIKICTSSENFLREAADIALKLGNNTLFVELSQKALTIAPKDPKLLEMKGRFHFSNAELIMAQKYAKMCINSASDASKCTAMLKSINSFQNNEKAATAAVAKKDFGLAQKHINSCKDIVSKYSTSNSPLSNRIKGIHIKILLAKNQKEEAVDCLNDLIKASPNDISLLTQRGELLIDLGDYSGALSDLQIVKKKTKQNSSENKKAIKLIEKASELQEKEKNVDYYTILGLKHGASMKDVKAAYRKLVVKWHPDRFKEPLKKKEAEKKMKMINRAYDVLSDEQKKKMYDLGQDPDNQIPNGPPPGSEQYQYNNFRGGNGGRTFYKTSGNGNNFDAGDFGGFGGFGGGDFGFDMGDILKMMMGGNGGNFQFTTKTSGSSSRSSSSNRNTNRNTRSSNTRNTRNNANRNQQKRKYF